MTRRQATRTLAGAAWLTVVMVTLKLMGAAGPWWVALCPVPVVAALLGVGWTIVTTWTFVVAMLENRDQHRRR